MTYKLLLLLLVSVVLTATVNINTANKEELMKLPYIGEKKSLRIIEYRKKNGKFKKLEDFTNVKGIGEKTLEKLKPLITINSQEKINKDEIKISENPSGKININFASKEELKILPVLKANIKKIIRYRKKHYFIEINELRYLGIDKKELDEVKDFITTKISINSIKCEKLLNMKFFNKEFLKDIIFYKKKNIKITRSFLKKRFEQYKIDVKLMKIFYIEE